MKFMKLKIHPNIPIVLLMMEHFPEKSQLSWWIIRNRGSAPIACAEIIHSLSLFGDSLAMFDDLVGGLEQVFMFHHIWVVILPIDELIFFKMVETTNQ